MVIVCNNIMYSSSNSQLIIMSEENNYSSTQRQPLHVGVSSPMTDREPV